MDKSMRYVSVAWSRLIGEFFICVLGLLEFPSPFPSSCSRSCAPDAKEVNALTFLHGDC
jgi:hypothetical protein